MNRENKIKISERFLTAGEISILNKDIRHYPDLTYVSPRLWGSFSRHFVLYHEKRFIGVCAVIILGSWIKIGPFALRNGSENKGYGTMLLSYIVKKYKRNDLYVGSSNPALGTIAKKLGFEAYKSYFSLPKAIRRYLISALLRFLNIVFFAEGVRKAIIYGKRPYCYYLRYAQKNM